MYKTLCSILLGSAVSSVADVSLPKILTSNMVLQRDAPITVWGWADAGEKVSVDLGGKRAQATADADGNWKVVLPKRGLGKELTLTVKGKNTIQLEHILMGDVWLCSGQSNMEWGIGLSENPKEAIAAANHPTIRLFDVGKVPSETPLKDIAKGSGWKICSPESVAKTGTRNGFSAVGYFFGQALQQGLGEVPIGLIDSSWGGTRIEPWTTPDGRKSVAEIQGKPGKYSKLYNGMVHGLSPLAIKGTIWYQGESNRKDAMLYHHKKRALINGWRKIWGEEMPFYFVQLAPFSYAKDKNSEVLPIIWEAQSRSNDEIDHTGMAVTIDLGNPRDIHPKKKREVGQRLALLALKDTYAKNVKAYSPTCESSDVEGSKVVLTFKDAEAGLVSRDSQPITGFELAGEDGKFVAAKAELKSGTRLVVTAEGVNEPKQVRYAWSNTPNVNLMSKEGLPVACFRRTLEK